MHKSDILSVHVGTFKYLCRFYYQHAKKQDQENSFLYKQDKRVCRQAVKCKKNIKSILQLIFIFIKTYLAKVNYLTDKLSFYL